MIRFIVKIASNTKSFFVEVWYYIISFPLFLKILTPSLKAYLYVRKQLQRQAGLTKKEADKICMKAFEYTYGNDLKKYSDAETFGHYVIRAEMLSWIKWRTLTKNNVDQFCDKEMQDLEKLIDEGGLAYRITASDYVLIEDQLLKYKELQKESLLCHSEADALH